MKDIFNWKELKQHILTGISYFIPLVVGAGLTMAIGRVLAGQSVANLGDSGLGYWLFQTGSLGMQMMVPMLCAYIAFSMGRKTGAGSRLYRGLGGTEYQHRIHRRYAGRHHRRNCSKYL